MITYKTIGEGGQKVIQIPNSEMAVTHFQLLVNSAKITVVSISKSCVKVHEVGKNEIAYSGDESDMADIVAIASKLHKLKEKIPEKKIAEQINK